MENRTTGSNRSSYILKKSEQVSKTKRNKKPDHCKVIHFLFLWCFCILSVRNFRTQITNIKNNNVDKRIVMRSLHNQSTSRATNYTASTIGLKTKFKQNARVVANATKSLAPPSNHEKSRAIPSIGSNVINSGGALCILSDRWYGRTFNRILGLANALAIIADNANSNTTKQTFIGLAPNLSEWYESFLDQRNDIKLNYTGPCSTVWTSKDLFHVKEYKNSKKSRQQLQHLVPQKRFRDEAEQALARYSSDGKQQVVTVHRRNLEGACVQKASATLVACVKDRVLVKRSMSTNALVDTCNYNYTMIHDKHRTDIDQNKSVVVLCTDQQVPILDDTFPIRSNYSFPVEAWMMVKSDVHYGNPHSTVDLVVAVWRSGQNRRTHPEQCYEED